MKFIFEKYGWLFLLGFYLLIWLFSLRTENVPKLEDIEFIKNTTKEIFTGIVAIISIATALEGLNTWRYQLVGKYNFELACRGLRAIQDLKTTYLAIRDMWRFTIDEKKIESSNEKIVNLQILREYWNFTDEFKSAIHNIKIMQSEFRIAWENFPNKAFKELLEWTNLILISASTLILSFPQEKYGNFVEIDLSSEDHFQTRLFSIVCSDFLFNTTALKKIYPELSKWANDAIENHHGVIEGYLTLTINNHIKNIV